MKSGRRSPRSPIATLAACAVLALAVGLTLTAPAPASSASTGEASTAAKKTVTSAKKKGARPHLKILTRSQAALLKRPKLQVRIRAPRPMVVRLQTRQGRRGGLTRPRRIRIRQAGTRRVKLRLTKRGRRHLLACGAQRVRVRGRFRPLGARRSGRVTAKRRLARAKIRCTLRIRPPHAERCDPIDQANCLLPFPNDYYTVPDPDSATGRRLHLNQASMPANTAGQRFPVGEYNRNDGFSPNNTILARVPGMQSPAAFAATGIVPQNDIAQYARPKQPVLLIDTVTGKRHPIWAELDRVPSADSQRLLIIHPAAALDYGRRYVVALRWMRDANGERMRSNRIFAAYRDHKRTNNARIEARRRHMESIFDTLAAAGIKRRSLYLAWDFTVASRQNLTGRLLAMRDDAFAALGDGAPGDRIAAGAAPVIGNLQSVDYGLCDWAAGQPCAADESNYIRRKVTGTIQVPCYMDAPAGGGPPCGPGSRLHYAPGAELPSRNGAATFAAPFTCLIPRESEAGSQMGHGLPGLVFGHGLLGNNRQTESLRLFPASMGAVSCGTDWIGMSSSDLAGNLPTILTDLGRFPEIPDRSQQGMLNVLYLARAMTNPAGFAALPEFGSGGQGALAVDPTGSSRVGFFGVSQGGIFGGAATAVAPDWDDAVLSVPGMGFSTLLTRSTQFNRFLPLVYENYPDPIARTIGISLLQLLWDRGETSGYAKAITGAALPGTPPHRVLIHEAFGDHQVANVQTEAMARTLGATLREPALAAGRSLDREPFWGITRGASSLFNGPAGGFPGRAALFVFDTGPIRVEDGRVVGTNPNPLSNVAPIDAVSPARPGDGLDPHEPVATSPLAQQGVAALLRPGGQIRDFCLAPPLSGAPTPCVAPPVHTLGEGL